MDIYKIMQVKKALYNIIANVSIPTACYKLIATAVCNTIFMQLTDPFHSRMKVSTVITLVVASVGIRMLNANPESIDVDSFEDVNRAKVIYTVPPTGRVSINLYNENGDILIQVDYRVNWGSNTNTIVLNTKTGGVWGTDQLVPGIKSPAGTLVAFVICAEPNDFSIIYKKKEVATYVYRINATVSKIEYQNNSYDSDIMRLSVLYYY